MVVFWIVAVLMVVVALSMILPPLFGKHGMVRDDRKEQNVIIARERLQELELERDSGELTQEEFEAYRDELEQSLLADVTGENGEGLLPHVQRSKQTANLLIVLVPLATVLLYLYLGSPALLQKTSAPGHAEMAGNEKLPSIDTMVDQLARRLENDPDDIEGWSLLAQSYMSINDYAGASKALKQLNRLQPDNPTIMLRYADALTMVRGGSFVGEPAELIRRAIAIEPDNLMGLWLAGMVSAEEGDFRQSLVHWRRLEPMLESDPRSLQEIQALISQAESKLGIDNGNDIQNNIEKNVVTASPQMELSVSLAPELSGKSEPEDTIFIIVRAADGPPMPLVAVRKRVADLPLHIKVDDSQVMVDGVSLIDSPALEVEARVSKSGSVRLQPGDMFGVVSPVTLPVDSPVDVVISDILN